MFVVHVLLLLLFPVESAWFATLLILAGCHVAVGASHAMDAFAFERAVALSVDPLAPETDRRQVS